MKIASNKALHRTAHKAPPVTADVQQMRSDPQNLNALAEGWRYRKKMRKSAGFAHENRPKHPKIAPKTEKHAISTPKHKFSGLNRLSQAEWSC